MKVGDRVRIIGDDSFRGEEGVIRELRANGAAGVRLDRHEEGLFHADADRYELVEDGSSREELKEETGQEEVD